MKYNYVSFYPHQIYSVLSIYKSSIIYITPYEIPEEWQNFFKENQIENIKYSEIAPEEHVSIENLAEFRRSTESEYLKWPEIPNVYPAFIVTDDNKDFLETIDVSDESMFNWPEEQFPKWASDDLACLVTDRDLLTKLLIES